MRDIKDDSRGTGHSGGGISERDSGNEVRVLSPEEYELLMLYRAAPQRQRDYIQTVAEKWAAIGNNGLHFM